MGNHRDHLFADFYYGDVQKILPSPPFSRSSTNPLSDLGSLCHSSNLPHLDAKLAEYRSKRFPPVYITSYKSIGQPVDQIAALFKRLIGEFSKEVLYRFKLFHEALFVTVFNQFGKFIMMIRKA